MLLLMVFHIFATTNFDKLFLDCIFFLESYPSLWKRTVRRCPPLQVCIKFFLGMLLNLVPPLQVLITNIVNVKYF